MSIQQSREKMGRNRAQALTVDADFFGKINAEKDKLDEGKSQHPADWRRLRSKVAAWMQDSADKLGSSDRDRAAWDYAEGVIAYADAKIGLADLAQAAAPVAGPPASGWINAKTKQAVRTYAPGERISASNRSDVTVGAMIEGLLVGPRNDAVKAALSSGTDSAGGFTVPLEVASEFFDLLRSKSVFIQAGARSVMVDGPTRMIRLDQDPTAIWRAENATIGDTDIAVGEVLLDPKSLSALVKVPYELLQDSVNIEQILTQALLGSLSLALDRACLFGSGADNQPRGLYNTSGIGAISMGTNGAALTSYDPLVDMLYTLELANAMAPTAAIWHPRTGRDLRKLKDTQNQPLMAPDPIPMMPKLATTSVPINLDQGTAMDVASPIMMGDFNDGILALREELTITRLDQTFASNGQVGFWARIRADVGFARAGSFVKLDGILPPA